MLGADYEPYQVLWSWFNPTKWSGGGEVGLADEAAYY